MSKWTWMAGLAVVGVALVAGHAAAAEKSAAERGKEALETRCFTPATFPAAAYDKLWEAWGVKSKPGEGRVTSPLPAPTWRSSYSEC